jgi:GDP-mannose 6-dehydrogenase
MKIAVFGLGYVGMTEAACLAHQGHEVVGVDVNDEKIAMVNSGRSPIAEPGLAELIEAAVEKRLLLAIKDPAPHIDSCRVAFVCVGTPSAPDGSHNMTYVAEVSRQIAAMIGPGRDEPLTVAYRSTMRPGTTDELVRPILEQGAKGPFELVYNPEFLRESVAIADFFEPPKIVIGTHDARPCEALDLLNAEIKAPLFYTHYREAELTKFVDNTFHAVKIAFANEIGRICGELGISARTVHQIFVSDTKLNISPYYFRPGGPFGGSCLPKDVRALQHIAGDIGAHTHLVDALLRSNEAHKHYLFERCVRGLKPGARILMLGLAFKVGSDDMRESPNIDLARKFLQANFALSIYDPHIEPAKLLGQNLGYAFSNLPTFRRLLVSKTAAESEQYDLIVDTRGLAKELTLHAGRSIDINTLD